MTAADDAGEMRLDALAAAAGVATTTIRLYRQRGLLPAPRLAGRTGWYDRSHLARLRLIARLQQQGFSLAAIGTLLDTWQGGRDLSDLVEVEEQLDTLLHRRQSVLIEPAELAGRFPPGALTADLLQRAARLGLVEATDDGRLRVPDVRFLDVGADLAGLGVPLDVVLDEWERLVAHTDELAARYVAVFEAHVLPDDRGASPDAGRGRRLGADLARLRHDAGQVLLAALDASMARVAAERLGHLVDAATD